MDSNTPNTQNTQNYQNTQSTQPYQQPYQQSTPTYQAPPAYQPYQNFSVNNIPPEYRPISMWGYFGWQLLFSIPCVGFILLIVFALGGTSNINLKNFARSYFCYFIIIAILVVILMLTGVGAGILSSF